MPSQEPDLDALIEAMVSGDRTAEFPIKQLGARAVPALLRAMGEGMAGWPSPADPSTPQRDWRARPALLGS